MEVSLLRLPRQRRRQRIRAGRRQRQFLSQRFVEKNSRNGIAVDKPPAACSKHSLNLGTCMQSIEDDDWQSPLVVSLHQLDPLTVRLRHACADLFIEFKRPSRT